MLITKKFTFDSAHNLLNYSGKCKNLHGHTYVLYITAIGEVNKKTGMVLDFQDLKKIVNDRVLEKLDHTYLNNILKQPTAENLVLWIYEKLKDKIELYKIELWETPDSYVTYYNKKYENN